MGNNQKKFHDWNELEEGFRKYLKEHYCLDKRILECMSVSRPKHPSGTLGPCSNKKKCPSREICAKGCSYLNFSDPANCYSSYEENHIDLSSILAGLLTGFVALAFTLFFVFLKTNEAPWTDSAFLICTGTFFLFVILFVLQFFYLKLKLKRAYDMFDTAVRVYINHRWYLNSLFLQEEQISKSTDSKRTSPTTITLTFPSEGEGVNT